MSPGRRVAGSLRELTEIVYVYPYSELNVLHVRKERPCSIYPYSVGTYHVLGEDIAFDLILNRIRWWSGWYR